VIEAETVELGAAARSLHLSTQGLWALIEQQGMIVLRRRRGAAGVSALTRVDYERLHALVRDGVLTARPAGAAPTRDENYVDPLMERVRAAEARALDQQAEAGDLRMRLEKTRLALAEARASVQRLRQRYGAELRGVGQTLAARSQQLDEQREATRAARARTEEGAAERQRESERHAAERAQLQDEQRALREEIARLRGDQAALVAELRHRIQDLRRELSLAHEVEQANSAYIDRLERGGRRRSRPA